MSSKNLTGRPLTQDDLDDAFERGRAHSESALDVYRAGVQAGYSGVQVAKENRQSQPVPEATVPSDHLGSRLSSINDAIQRAHLLANDAETIEMKLFGHAPNAGPNGIVSPGQDKQIAGPLAERFGDAARNLSAALDRLQTSLARIGRHVE